VVSRERGRVPRGSSRTLGDPPWGSIYLCQEQSSENVEKVPRESGKWKVLEVQDNEPT